MNIYIDCTDLFIDSSNTGIRRVERNILKSDLIKNKNNNSKLNIIPVAYLGVLGGIKAITIKNQEFNLNYFQKIYFLSLTPNRLKRLSKAIFPPASNWLENNWKNLRFILLPILLILAPILGFLSFFIILIEKRIKPQKNDIYFIPGSSWWSHNLYNPLASFKKRDVKIAILLHDLIPIDYPEHCQENFLRNFKRNLEKTVAISDLIICISKSTYERLNLYLDKINIKKKPVIAINYSGFKLDLCEDSQAIRPSVLKCIHNSYITVGTIEPRKNHSFILDSFDNLWSSNSIASLCIIGKYGWKADEIAQRILSHPLYGKQLFWFDDLNDNELLYAYTHAKACVYPSITEGFGLPLIEALCLKCPVLASNIPVFNEVGGKHCHYFELDNPTSLSNLIFDTECNGLLDKNHNQHTFKWIDWNESTENLFKILTNS
ncbi:glycosyltransferase family 4 protein [Methylococcaceae bacterium WWC4]|nr:glycosyltransferase family 4 protein [Methylococcaceae bacterium WWC4]